MSDEAQPAGSPVPVLGRTVGHAIEHVEVFPAPSHVSTVRMSSDELTSLCPVTQQPDLADVVITHEPDRWATAQLGEQ